MRVFCFLACVVRVRAVPEEPRWTGCRFGNRRVVRRIVPARNSVTQIGRLCREERSLEEIREVCVLGFSLAGAG